jgi:hypothetical protein
MRTGTTTCPGFLRSIFPWDVSTKTLHLFGVFSCVLSVSADSYVIVYLNLTELYKITNCETHYMTSTILALFPLNCFKYLSVLVIDSQSTYFLLQERVLGETLTSIGIQLWLHHSGFQASRYNAIKDGHTTKNAWHRSLEILHRDRLGRF